MHGTPPVCETELPSRFVASSSKRSCTFVYLREATEPALGCIFWLISLRLEGWLCGIQNPFTLPSLISRHTGVFQRLKAARRAVDGASRMTFARLGQSQHLYAVLVKSTQTGRNTAT